MYVVSDNSPQHIADWAEWYVSHSSDTLSKTMLTSILAQTLYLDDELIDELVDNVFLELRYRERLYGPNSPIKIEGRVLSSQVSWKDEPHYLACLIFSLTGNAERATYAGKLFEEVSAAAVKQYIGGEAIICGFPKPVRARNLAAAASERFVREFPSTRKDRNLDLMAWRPFGDTRPGQLVILVQCAAGRNWPLKTKELVLEAWKKYVQFHVPPLRGFTMPYIISDPEEFEEHSTDAGIILDRVRIYRFTQGVTLDAQLKKKLTTWCKGRVAAMNAN